MAGKTTVFLPDSQIPYHDRKALRAIVGFVGQFQPDEVIHIADVLDFPQPSRWTKDTRAEFEGSIYRDVEVYERDFADPLREVYAGPVGFHEGNHDARPREYLEKYAPALSGTKAFHMENLLNFEKYDFRLLPEFHSFAPGWVSTHGHRGGIRLNQTAGLTALNAAKKFGRSVVMGHTHRLGKVSYTYGYGGTGNTLTGVEVGNVMNMKLAQYLRGGTANWQQGFAIARVSGQSVHVDTIPIVRGKFQVDGAVFAV